MEQNTEPRCEILTGGTRVYTAPPHTFGTDGLLLARFGRPRPDAPAVDLCSGCGIVALEWFDGGHRGRCDAVEIDPLASALCRRSAAESGAAQLNAVCADLNRWRPDLWGQYERVACNPPYFLGGHPAADPARALARHEGGCTLEQVAALAAGLLRTGGKFTLVQKPSALARVCAVLSGAGVEPKRLQFVRGGAGLAPSIFLLEAARGRRPGLVLEPDLILERGAALYGPASARPAH